MHRIRIGNEQREFLCGEDRSLLIAMAKKGANYIPVGCRAGGCGVCKIRILTGKFETKAMSRAKVSVLEETEGLALACRVFPRSDMDIEVVDKNGGRKTDRQENKTQ